MSLVSEVRALKSAAATERRRRAVAKEWADRQDEENLFKQGWDWLTDGDKPPAGPAPVPLPEPHEPVVSTWAEPAPGAAGAVSSARPSDLRTYASNLSGASENVSTGKGGAGVGAGLVRVVVLVVLRATQIGRASCRERV